VRSTPPRHLPAMLGAQFWGSPEPAFAALVASQPESAGAFFGDLTTAGPPAGEIAAPPPPPTLVIGGTADLDAVGSAPAVASISTVLPTFVPPSSDAAGPATAAAGASNGWVNGVGIEDIQITLVTPPEGDRPAAISGIGDDDIGSGGTSGASGAAVAAASDGLDDVLAHKFTEWDEPAVLLAAITRPHLVPCVTMGVEVGRGGGGGGEEGGRGRGGRQVTAMCLAVAADEMVLQSALLCAGKGNV